MKFLTSKIKEFFRKTLSRVGSDPKKDWSIFLIVISVVLVLLFIYHISLFFSSFAEINFNSDTTSSSVKTIDREGLTSAINNLQSKKAKYSNFISNPPTLHDPSF